MGGFVRRSHELEVSRLNNFLCSSLLHYILILVEWTETYHYLHDSNALVYSFMTEGIPIVYYGTEQGFSGSGDPVRPC